MHAERSFHRATRRDIPRLAELWAHAFPGERTVEQRVRQLESGGVYGGIEHAWYLVEDDRLLGAFRGYPLKQYLHGAALPMLGVAAVAVAADARRQGVGGELCREALRIGRERGDVVSVLYPFRPDFYRRYGWGLAGALHGLLFRTHALPVRVLRPRVRLAAADDLDRVQACYARVAAASHGLIERTDRIWANHLNAPDTHLYLLDDGGRTAGYLLVRYGRSRAPDRRVLIIKELIGESGEAYHELLSWIALQRDQWARVRYDALPEERLDLLLEDPRPPGFRSARELWAPAGRWLRGPMLRILDVVTALNARPHWGGEGALRFRLRVQDSELPENEGPWEVAFDAGRVTCTPAPAGPADLEIRPAEFAQLYAGEITVSEAVRLGGAACSMDPGALDRIFRAERTLRLLDDF